MATSSEKVYLPLPPPPTTFTKDPRAALTTTEQGLYDQVHKHFTREEPPYAIPNLQETAGPAELSEQEKFWLSRECLLRYLRASKWKANAAIQRLESTLKWRREYGVYDLVNADHVEPEAVTGKEILFGYEVKGKPACYMLPSRQNTTDATRQIQFVVWMLERTVDLMEPGVENLCLLINFADKAKSPTFSTSREVLNILQNHYPERLGYGLVINVPFLVTAFFKLIMPFVDPITREKVKFNPQIVDDKIFTADNAIKEWWGGDRDFEYVHEKYWPALISLCESRTKEWLQTWKRLGAKVGISEWDYKKGPGSGSDTPEKGKEDDNKEVIPMPETTPAPAVEATLAAPAVTIPQVKEVETTPKKSAESAGLAEQGSVEAATHEGLSTVAVSAAGAVAGEAGGDDAGDSCGGGADAGGE